MTEHKNKIRAIKKRILSLLLKISTAALIVLFMTIGIISIPYIQTILIQKFTSNLLERIGYEIKIDYISIRWFDTILLKDVEIRDTKDKRMVSAERIILDFKLGELLARNSINFDKALLVGTDVDMLRNAPENRYNLDHFIEKLKEALASDKPDEEKRSFVVDNMILKSSKYRIYNPDHELIKERFDHHHFTLEKLDANLSSFLVKPGHISFIANNLECVDSATRLDIKQFQTRFVYTRTSMVFQNMTATLGRSTINQSMVFNYDKPSSLKYFEDSVKITANVKKSLLHSSDLGLFVPSVAKYRQYYKLKGFLEGPIHRFDAKNITIEFGQSSRLEGYISLYGMPSIKETFINASINTASFNVLDLAPYMNEESLERAKKFGRINFDGRFSGFLNDFVSNASFTTEIGYVDTDINLKISNVAEERTTYSGRLKTINFDLGALVGDTTLYQLLDLNGQIKGSGLTKETAQFDLKSKIDRLGIKNYNYQNISTDAKMADEFFHGQLIIDDPNLQFKAGASIDLTENKDIIKIVAQLDTAFLQPLNISERHAFIRSDLEVDMTGLELDNLLGNIFLKNTYIEFEDRNLNLDTFLLISEKDSISRSLRIESPNIQAHLFGDYDFSMFFKDAANIGKEYWLLFKNDEALTSEYYASKRTAYSDYYYLDFDINLIDFNPILQLFKPDLFISERTGIIGSFTGGPVSFIEIDTEFERFDLGKYSFQENSVHINTSKSPDTTLVYAEYLIRSSKQFYSDKQSTADLLVDVDWQENHLDFTTSIHQYQENNYARITGEMDFLPNETHIALDPSEILLIEKYWYFNEENTMVLKNKDYEISNLQLFHEDQVISVNGRISEDPFDNLYTSIKNFDIKNVNPLINYRLDGTINGYIDLKNFFVEKDINSRFNFKAFKFDEFLVGDILATANYEHVDKRFKVDLDVNRLGIETIDIAGYLKPSEEENQLDLTASFTQANLNLGEPFLNGMITNIKGSLYGSLKIGGRFKYPVIEGTGSIENGQFLFGYLNTHYYLDGDVEFSNDKITSEGLILRDDDDNTGIVTGEATHRGFKEVSYDIRADLDNMQVLNTTLENNELYYGTAFATGDVRVYGKQKNVFIDATARSEKGTRFFIPLEGSTEVVQEEYITFISLKEEGDSIDDDSETNTGINLEGVNLNMDLELTPDAYCEIIFDITSGDIIRGRGNGKLKLQIDTQGDFNMFGDYEIQEGGYNFTLYNIINKEFQILPNSRINWTGNPYAAELDIKATYRQMASLLPILENVDEDEAANNADATRKYPANVLLDIKGDLRFPEIEFGIDVEDYPKNAVVGGISLETHLTAFKNKLATDEQELKRQVFSLIILKNFSDQDAFNVGGSVGKSVSEFISNQISYWITQFDENLVIDVDLGALDDEAFNTFQLRMSYSFLEGRLRITRDGGFTDQNSNTDAASVLGDWTVEYLLTPDGKYRAKIYNKTNYNTLNPNLKNTSTTAGFSLMHTQSFDQLKEIFSRARKKAQQEKEEVEEMEDDDLPEEEDIPGTVDADKF